MAGPISHHHAGGWSGLAATIARAGIWTVIGRVVFSSPAIVAAVIFALSALFLLFKGRS